jgi:isopenicillin N synthase-like dioxygenase
MYLNVILTIFVIVQVVTMILMYKWWNKYGRKLFTTFTDMKSKIPNQMFNSVASNNVKGPNPFGNIPDMSDMMKQFENMTKNMGKK